MFSIPRPFWFKTWILGQGVPSMSEAFLEDGDSFI